jgi:hypothetical protein
MPNPFNPDDEAKQARKFRTLAAMFEENGTMGLSERFAILAVLSEQKAKVLKELEEATTSQSKDSQAKGKSLDWPAIKLKTRNTAKEN